MQRIFPEINKLGAELVAISPELSVHTLPMVEKNALAFHVLSDQGNKFARQCGLVFTLAEELRPLYKGWGIDLPAHNGDATFELPLPATYVVDQESLIVSSFADADYTQRLEPSTILDVLQTLAG